MLLTYPLIAAIQEVSARIGRVTGCGIAANLRRCYPLWLLMTVIGLMVVGTVFNLGADIGAMGAAAQLLLPARDWRNFRIGVSAAASFRALHQLSEISEWLTRSLFAYVATAFFVKIHWGEVVHAATLLPHLSWAKEYLTGLIAVLGTTISPHQEPASSIDPFVPAEILLVTSPCSRRSR